MDGKINLRQKRRVASAMEYVEAYWPIMVCTPYSSIIVDRKMAEKTLTQLKNRVKDAHMGSAPVKVDHKKAANPYKSQYGFAWGDVDY
jgi:hypothetical protein